MSEIPEMKVTQKEMKDARIPLQWRDYCAHLLIPLNKCRYDNYYLPWHCKVERHEYEKCQYDDFQRRKRVFEKRKRAEERARIEAAQNATK
ncbi:hypothetical protein DSO57_1021096 [Entomophthora muscae]|uniref:Uncharacterized protein n=2 Tax=Entomophthora muscae TaxID=34485 RepID=A0ACC2TSZ6_9FUNG|nr:hypothetical protein DSO57_1013821 [Entomophthora muscae]KAJ9084737.1 hypothetical protein DSO57_1021096 [Entomophthora muscae]